MGGGCPKSGIEGNIIFLPIGRTRLNVAPTLAISTCAGTPSTLAARDFIQGIINFTRDKFFFGFYFLAPIPPTRISRIKYFLRASFGLACFFRNFANSRV
jgi:hypothetical protein